MFGTPVWMYNAYRYFNPIRIETATEAQRYGAKIIQRYYPHENLPEGKWRKPPYIVDYRYYVIQEPIDAGDKWYVGYLERDRNDGWLDGGGPCVDIDKNTGQIFFPNIRRNA